MDARRFNALLDAYGAQPRLWPEHERAAAAAFADTPEGRSALDEARAMDWVLAQSAGPQPSPGLRARVLAAAPTARSKGAWGWWRQGMRSWAPGAGLAAAGVAGVLFGAALSGSGADMEVELLLAEAAPYDEAVLMEGAP